VIRSKQQPHTVDLKPNPALPPTPLGQVPNTEPYFSRLCRDSSSQPLNAEH
jgi:hypothetical protein